MAKRLSHALLEARLEGLAEELNMSNTTIKDAAYTGFVKGTATVALTAAQSGRTIIVGPLAAGLAADATFSLPTAADGLFYRFVYVGGAADAQDFWLDTGSDTNFFIGGVIQHDIGGEDGAAYHRDNGSNSIAKLLTPESGTWVEIFCDGTNWFLTGHIVSATNTAVVFADQ